MSYDVPLCVDFMIRIHVICLSVVRIGVKFSVPYTGFFEQKHHIISNKLKGAINACYNISSFMIGKRITLLRKQYTFLICTLSADTVIYSGGLYTHF